jgi:hypothetical protein
MHATMAFSDAELSSTRVITASKRTMGSCYQWQHVPHTIRRGHARSSTSWNHSASPPTIRSSSARTGMRVGRHEDLTGPEVTNASYPDSSYTGAIDSDAVPKDLDRMIDAALDRGAEVLWDDAGHRAAMQVTADRVEELNGRELGIIEAD